MTTQPRRILVAIKRVVDYNVRIRVRPDGSGVMLDGVKLSINPFDQIAIEEALRIKEIGRADEVVVATIAPADAQATLRNALAMRQAEGQSLFKDLVRKSDVVIENFRPGVLERLLGVTEAELRGAKPELIWCSISGFGQTGPYRDKPAYDMIVQALSGGMSLTGEPGRAAVRAGIPIGDLAAGMYAVMGVLAALVRRGSNGRGNSVDISMLDCQAALLCYQAAYHLHSGNVPGRQGSGHASPYGLRHRIFGW